MWAGDDRWSFQDLDGLANAFARHLVAQGVASGDRVAVMTANRVELVVAVHAASKIGAALTCPRDEPERRRSTGPEAGAGLVSGTGRGPGIRPWGPGDDQTVR